MPLVHANAFIVSDLIEEHDQREMPRGSVVKRLMAGPSAALIGSDLSSAVVVATRAARVYTLETESEEEAKKWTKSINDMAARASALADPAALQRLAAESTTKAGFADFVAVDGARAYGVVRDESFLAFASIDESLDGDATPVFTADLRHAAVIDAEKRGVLLVQGDGRVTALTVEGDAAARAAFASALSAGVRRANRLRARTDEGGADAAAGDAALRTGFMSLRDAKRLVELRTTGLAWYAAKKREKVIGSLPLAHCRVSQVHAPANGVLVIGGTGKRYVFVAPSAAEATAWAAAINAVATQATDEAQASYSSARAHQEELVALLLGGDDDDFGILRCLFKVYGTDDVARSALSLAYTQKRHLALVEVSRSSSCALCATSNEHERAWLLVHCTSSLVIVPAFSLARRSLSHPSSLRLLLL